MYLLPILTALLITPKLALTLVLPTNPNYNILLPRQQTCAETCGRVCYYQRTIDAAVLEGYTLYLNGQTEGSNQYPHTYRNSEGFPFTVPGPYLEFPIMSDFDEYDGGSPGPDRVIFNQRGVLAGVITHTGASGNGFVECVG